MIFVIILYEELQREMCLTFAKEEGFAFLGIKAKKEEFILPPNLQERRAY